MHLSTTLILTGIVLLTGCRTKPAKPTDGQARSPNVICIFSDDLGIGDLSCYGATLISTPHIDRMAGQGVQFSNAYSTSASCQPSRFGLLTGIYPWRVTQKDGAADYSGLLIDTTRVTLAGMFAQAGYNTGVIGIWHFIPDMAAVHHSGFDYEFILPPVQDQSKRIYMENGQVSELEPSKHISSLIMKKFEEYISAHKDRPFFLYIGTQGIDMSQMPDPKFEGKSQLGVRGDMILQLDGSIGQILQTLDRYRLMENTLILFTSDNGPVINERTSDSTGYAWGTHNPGGMYRGGKHSIYEAGSKVPLIICWPAGVKPSKQQTLFSHVDIYASLAALLNQQIQPGQAQDSEDHLPVLLGKEVFGREYIIEQSLHNTLAIAKGRWKYIEPAKDSFAGTKHCTELGDECQPQLYDLSADPQEQHNVARQNPQVVAELSALLKKEKEK